MNEKKDIINFIKHVTSSDYKKANQSLAAVVNEKIKQRIATANQKLAAAGNK